MKFKLPLLSLVILFGFSSCQTKNQKVEIVHKNPTDSAAGVVAKVDGTNISAKEVFKSHQGDIFELEKRLYDLKYRAFRENLLEKFIKEDKRSSGISREEFVDKYIAKKFNPTKKEIDAFIVDKKIPKNHVNEQLKKRIVDYMQGSKKVEQTEAWLDQKLVGKKIEFFVLEPKEPFYNVKIGNAPKWGSDSAKIKIVEFSDFQCPHCGRVAKIIGEYKKKANPKDVQIVFKNFPLKNIHKDAEGAAIASYCANEQSADLFWKFHDGLFNNQSKMKVKDLKDQAKKVGLDVAKFSACLDTKKFKSAVDQDLEQGLSLGVSSTPTIFVNGSKIRGVKSADELAKIVNEKMNSKKSATL